MTPELAVELEDCKGRKDFRRYGQGLKQPCICFAFVFTRRKDEPFVVSYCVVLCFGDAGVKTIGFAG